jgi:predicted ribosomally synthesized peptide with nif11-like leader
MSKENIAKFQETIAQKPELLEKLKDARTPEAVVAVARAEGFDFTEEDMRAFAGEQAGKGIPLSDEELGKAAGGLYDDNGRPITTPAYGCSHWLPSTNPWLAVKGQCGSCSYWTSYAFAGICHCRANFNW